MLILFAFCAQPACLLYTRCVMQSAAAEGCRLVATRPSVGTAPQALRDYMLRRLAAVPDADVFHLGGKQGWVIELDGSQGAHVAHVRIQTSVRPLPLVGAACALLGQTDGQGNVVVCVEMTTTTRPAWLEGGYSDWSDSW